MPVCDRLHAFLERIAPDGDDGLTGIIQRGLDSLPMPGAGSTIERWRALAAVAKFDLSLAKLYEGHTDALAIMAELGVPASAVGKGAWAVWAAEAPGGRAIVQTRDGGDVLLEGAKFWCSGATICSHALLTAWDAEGNGPQLVAIDLDQERITIDRDKWKAVGMAGSQSVNVAFDGARGRRVGAPGEYLSRPGFWHGGAGVAACWYGGSVGIADALRRSLLSGQRTDISGYRLASLGKVELAMEETAGVLRRAARWIDENPAADASKVALTARLSGEKCAKRVLDEAGKAMGATPFCLDEKFARAAADLPVFIRQSHAERDFAALGERALQGGETPWTL